MTDSTPLAGLRRPRRLPESSPTIEDRFDLARLDWRKDAVCAQTDPDVFYPDNGQPSRHAKRFCATCPVKTPCLDYALRHDERFGVWGGLSERQRRDYKPA